MGTAPAYVDKWRRWVIWCWVTWVALEKGPLNESHLFFVGIATKELPVRELAGCVESSSNKVHLLW